MKKLLLLAILTITFIACSEVDEPLDPTEESFSAPEQLNTTVLQLISNKVFFYNQFS